MEGASRRGGIEADGSRFVDRQPRFRVQLPDRVRPLCGGGLAACGVSRCGHGVGQVGPRLPARGETGRNRQRTGGQARRLPGQVPLQDPLPGIAPGDAGILDVVQHLPGDGSGAVKEVELDAVADAVLLRPERVSKLMEYEPALVDVGALAAAVGEGEVGVEAHEPVVEPEDHAVGVDVLQEVAVPRLDEAPADVDEIAAELVVAVGGRHDDPVGDGEQRRRRQLLVRLAVGVEHLEPGRRAGGDQAGAAEKGAVTRLRGVEVVLRLVVVGVPAAVGRDPRPVEGAPAGFRVAVEIPGFVAGRGHNRLPGFVPPGAGAVDDVALRSGRAAVLVEGAVVQIPVVGLVRHAEAAVAGPDRPLVVVAYREQEPALVPLKAGGQADVEGLAVPGPGGPLEKVDLYPLHPGPGDDVDDAADGVRSVDGRGPVLEHLDPLDDGGGNGVEVDGGVGPGPARHEAAAVDQHQGALGSEPAQVDAGGAVPPVVGLGVDGVGLHDEGLQHVPDGGQALPPDLLLRHDGDRRRREAFRALDAGAGDGDLLDYVDLQVVSFFRECAHCRGDECCGNCLPRARDHDFSEVLLEWDF